MKNTLATALALALGLGLPAAAQADIRFSGFGQVVAGTTGDDAERFPGRGYNGDLDFKEESLFALQINADLNERVDAVAQLLARGTDDFDAELTWAYANVKLGNGFSTKIGRQRTAFYRYSDFLDVGYAYPWMRPPRAVYNLGLSTTDGISLNHQTFLGDWFSSVQVQYGNFDGTDRVGGTTDLDVQLNNLAGIAWDVEYNDWLSLRAAYFRGDITIQGTSLDALTSLLVSNGQGAIASQLDYNDDTGVFTNVGFRVDRAGWLVVGEYVTVKNDGALFAERSDWYLSTGYRMGSAMPHITYGSRQSDPRTDILASINPANPFLPFVAAAVANEQLDETYLGIGVRWDFASNVAFKADWTRHESDVGAQPSADLVSVGLVFTF